MHRAGESRACDDEDSVSRKAQTNRLPRIFDGHNDALLRLWRMGPESAAQFISGRDEGHLDLPRARASNFGGGFFAVFISATDANPPKPPRETGPEAVANERPVIPPRRVDAPSEPRIPAHAAMRIADEMIDLLHGIEKHSDGEFQIARDPAQLERAFHDDKMAAVLHFEGAEPIHPDLSNLHEFYERGLRSLGLVWSRENDFAHGVPFRFPHPPDTGPGLKDAGKSLVAASNELGIMIDLSHLNERGFWDVAKLSNAPLVATHSNAHALCPTSRNLTDDQLRAIRDSGGVTGVSLAVSDLRRDGKSDAQTPHSVIADHIDYIANLIGEDHVAIGTDLDGTKIPEEMKDVTGLPRILEGLEARGWSEHTLKKIAHENWFRVLNGTL